MKIFLQISLLILTLNSTLIANEKLVDYVAVKYLTQEVDGYGEGKTISINAGKSVGNSPLVVSAEFTNTLDEAKKNSDSISLYTLGGYLGYFYTATDNIYIIPNIGFIYEKTETTTKKDSMFGLSYSININYVLNEKFDILYDYTKVESKITHNGFGIRYRF